MSEFKARVLVVEDDHDLREAISDTLELSRFFIVQAESGEEALELLARSQVDMVISDVNMGGMDGLSLLKILRSRYPQLPVLLMTAYGSIGKSVEAIRNGAVDYLLKPFEPSALIDLVARYTVSAVVEGEGPVVEDPASFQLLQLAQRVAITDSTVLVCGESGTGKEVLARYIHEHSPRAKGPFVAVNCAAIPENMLEATLFGYEKGAFTGAYQANPGKFEQANGGTLLLDEISEMDVALQAKLLRVIQEREVERLGGRKTIALDVRLVATTNRNLQDAVSQGIFREDLYYRLSVFPLQWLPLRQRRQDILPIARSLLAKHSEKMRRLGSVHLSPEAEQLLVQHSWPGNVRELDNVIQRALIMQTGTLIGPMDLRLDPYDFSSYSVQHKVVESTPTLPDGLTNQGLGDDLQQREFEIILSTLQSTRGSRKDTAEKLGISPRTLRYKLAKMRESGIDLDFVANTEA